MHRSSLLLVCLFALSASVSAVAAPSIDWGTTGQLLYENDGSTFIIGDSASGSVGGFCQLIYTGADGYDGFSPDGNGTRGDDVVLGVSWMGAGFAMNSDGRFFDSALNEYFPPGSQFAIRFFEEPSAHWTGDADSEIPDAPGSFYGVIEGFSTSQALDGTGIDNFIISSAHTADFLLLARSFIDSAVAISTNQVNLVIGQLTTSATNTVERSFHLVTGVWEVVHGFLSSTTDTNWTDTIDGEWDKVYYRIETDDPNL